MKAQVSSLHYVHAGLMTAMVFCAVLAHPALAQESHLDGEPEPVTTSQEVRNEIGDAMDALRDYSAEQRKEALTTLDTALDAIDAEIARREDFLRKGWADMPDATRAGAAEALANMRTARNDLGALYERLESDADAAWGDLTDIVTAASENLRDAWSGGSTSG